MPESSATAPEPVVTRPLHVGIVGAGPAGVYTADALLRASSELPAPFAGVRVDLLDKLPTPFGLIRYGVAPDHPRIKSIARGMYGILDRPEVNFIGNVCYPDDIDLATLRSSYDAVVFATGAIRDRALVVPGVHLDGSYGAADFVSWYDAHPDVSPRWPLTAEAVAVVGAGNVALDVARVLAKPAVEMRVTDIPGHVEAGLTQNPVREVHLFARRGPAQAKFTPLELRELGESGQVSIVVDPADLVLDAASQAAIRESKQLAQVVATLEEYATGSARRAEAACLLHLHFMEAPVAFEGAGRVDSLVTERQELDGNGRARGTGRRTTWPVQAVYRAVGYQPDPVAGLAFDHGASVVANAAGRALDRPGGNAVPGVYVCGWVKRGPVGLIGHTRSDAKETVASLLADLNAGAPVHEGSSPSPMRARFERAGVTTTDWAGWHRLDAHEISLGAATGRERVKVPNREQMTAIAAAVPEGRS